MLSNLTKLEIYQGYKIDDILSRFCKTTDNEMFSNDF